MSNEKLIPEWKVVGHSYQIADTGDYDGRWEITNGKASLFTNEDAEEEDFKPIIDVLNQSGFNFYEDGDKAYAQFLESEIEELRGKAIREFSLRGESCSESIDGQKVKPNQELTELEWRRQIAKLLMEAPYNWKPQDARSYALDVDYSEYYSEGWTPEDTLSEDSTYWD